MKKIGLLALAVVMALGALGVGYAAWTDTIFIDGTVNTGSVDLNIIELSNTYVVKVPDEVAGVYDDMADEMVIVHQRVNKRGGGGITWSVINDPPMPPIPPNILVASAVTTMPCDNNITMTWDNAFPCVELTADFLVRYDGTIPVKVDALLTHWTGDAELLAQYAQVHFFYWDEVTGQGEEIIDCPVQLHGGECIYCVAMLHLPQDNALMSLNGSFTATINAIQWNEYEN
jgi:hypothetical protein